MSYKLDHNRYYRLPWTLSDNSITWLEPTTKCNLYCEGCYRENDENGHKPLEVVIDELKTVKKLRKCDGISIAGGEPLIYPHIVELVRYVADQGWKPIVNSNGQALTPELLAKLRDAGLAGFTFHVDSHQVRPGWEGKTEGELNELRLKLAKMVDKVGKGKIACAFNATIYRDTLKDIPMLTNWAQENIKIVHTMVYILFRSARNKGHYDAWANGKKVDVTKLMYHLDNQEEHKDVVAQEVVDLVREVSPNYEPCGYLNGTEDPETFKWLLGLRLGNTKKMYGAMDKDFIEIAQIHHHKKYGTYLAYTKPRLLRHAKTLMPLALINKGVRKIFWNWVKNPLNWFTPMRMQSIMIIQPCDIFADGRQNMCDGCPDAIPYKGRMVWSCRVDELEKFGCFLTFAPKEELKAETGKEEETSGWERQPEANA